jgi:hypothetical protein
LDPIGCVRSISQAASTIDFGRKGFAPRGKAEKGRISYEESIAKALSAFKEALAASNNNKKKF